MAAGTGAALDAADGCEHSLEQIDVAVNRERMMLGISAPHGHSCECSKCEMISNPMSTRRWRQRRHATKVAGYFHVLSVCAASVHLHNVGLRTQRSLARQSWSGSASARFLELLARLPSSRPS